MTADGLVVSFRNPTDNLFATGCNLSLAVLFCSCILFKYAELTQLAKLQEQMLPEQRSDFIFPYTVFSTIAMLACLFTFVLLVLITFKQAVYEARRYGHTQNGPTSCWQLLRPDKAAGNDFHSLEGESQDVPNRIELSADGLWRTATVQRISRQLLTTLYELRIDNSNEVFKARKVTSKARLLMLPWLWTSKMLSSRLQQ